MQDVTLVALQAALRGLATRQRVIANNVANIETPNFSASEVDFESSLSKALKAGVPQGTQVSVHRSSAPANWNGNNVSLDDETVGMVETNLRYQLTVEAVNNKFRLLSTAIKGTAQ